jgi:hypothetical protein
MARVSTEDDGSDGSEPRFDELRAAGCLTVCEEAGLLAAGKRGRLCRNPGRRSCGVLRPVRVVRSAATAEVWGFATEAWGFAACKKTPPLTDQ